MEKFKNDLVRLMHHHGVTLESKDSYDGEDRFIGTDQYPVIDGEAHYGQTFAEIIEEAASAAKAYVPSYTLRDCD